MLYSLTPYTPYIVVFMGIFPFRGLFSVKQLGYRIFPYDPSILGRCYSWHIASPRSRPRNQYGRRKHNSHHFSTAPRTPSNYHFSGPMLNFRGVINEHFFFGLGVFPCENDREKNHLCDFHVSASCLPSVWRILEVTKFAWNLEKSTTYPDVPGS